MIDNFILIPLNWYVSTNPNVYIIIKVINSSGMTLYAKITTSDPNITVSNNTYTLNDGTTTVMTPVLTIPKTIISFTLYVYVYTDAIYTNLVYSYSLPFAVKSVDLNSITPLMKIDFADGTAQGVVVQKDSNLSISTSIDTNNSFASLNSYSIKATMLVGSGPLFAQWVLPSITLPQLTSGSKLFLIFAFKSDDTNATTLSLLDNNNNTAKIFLNNQVLPSTWKIFTADISQYANTTQSFKIRFLVYHTGYYYYLDDVYIIQV